MYLRNVYIKRLRRKSVFIIPIVCQYYRRAISYEQPNSSIILESD